MLVMCRYIRHYFGEVILNRVKIMLHTQCLTTSISEGHLFQTELT